MMKERNVLDDVSPLAFIRHELKVELSVLIIIFLHIRYE